MDLGGILQMQQAYYAKLYTADPDIQFEAVNSTDIRIC